MLLICPKSIKFIVNLILNPFSQQIQIKKKLHKPFNFTYQNSPFFKIAMTKAKVKQALVLAGHQHTYQKVLVLLISLSSILFNFVTLGSTLIFMVPIFHCNGDFQTKVFQSQACKQMHHCQIDAPFTLTAQLELYCDNEWARDLIQSIFSFGAIAGLFVMNLLSDTKGRKIATIIGLSIMITGVSITILGGFLKSIPLVIIAQFIQGFGTSAMLSLSYAFLADYCSQTFKPRAVIFVNSAWSLSTTLIGVFYLMELSWLVFLLFGVLIPLVIIAVCFQVYLHQSPYILVLQDRKDQALKVLQKIAMTNQRYENLDKIKQVINKEEKLNLKKQASLKNLYKVITLGVYLRPLILLSLIRIIGCLNFYGTSYAFDVEGLGLGYNSIIASFMELVAFLFLTVYVNRIPRRQGIAGFYTLVIVVGLLFFFNSIKNNLIIGTTLMGISRIFSTTAYTLIASMQTESFTVEIQSTAVGITEAFGLIGAMCGPLMVDLGDKIDVDPVALIAIVVTFAVWPTFFLKETLNAHLRKDEKEPLLTTSTQDDDRDPKHISPVDSQSTIISIEDAFEDQNEQV